MTAGESVAASGAAATSFTGDTPKAVKHDSQTIEEIEILWITAGLGCDGDTIAMTAASQPSIEDLVLGTVLS